jgi:glutathione S-transferase
MKLYELCGADGRYFSPYCWRTRMALAHKGFEPTREIIHFCDKDRIAFSGQDKVPILVDGDHVVFDSHAIALYLDETYPDQPSLFGDAIGSGQAQFFTQWVNSTVHGPLLHCVIQDIFEHLDDASKDYFVESRTARMGKPLAEVQAGRDQSVLKFRKALTPVRLTFNEQPYLAGETPAGPDYTLFGAFQWARVVSPFPILEADDPVFAWRERMLGLFDGLAGKALGYPVI